MSEALIAVNLAAGIAVLAVLALRLPVRRLFGPRIAYHLWSAPLLAALAMLPPVREIRVPATAPLPPEAIVELSAPAPVTATAVVTPIIRLETSTEFAQARAALRALRR